MTPKQIEEICKAVNEVYGANRVQNIKAITVHFNDNISETFIVNIEDNNN